jgi:hypothetical protein
MIDLEDDRWLSVTGGYRMPFDPRPLLKRLEDESHTEVIWGELWTELYHQVDVGEASFAAVPFLVNSYCERGGPAYNTFTIVATIELARKEGKNPDVPQWFADDYYDAIRKLAESGAREVLRSDTEDDVLAMLGLIAIERGLRIHGKILAHYSEDELTNFESKV